MTPQLVLPALRVAPDRISAITVCTRPFRAQGPRLEAERRGDKTVIHQAREDLARVQDQEECRIALNAYLKAWRKGHLLVSNLSISNARVTAAVPQPAPAKVDSSLIPTIRPLSDKTALLTIPTFASEYQQPSSS